METASKRACTAAVNVTTWWTVLNDSQDCSLRSPRAAIVPRTWARTSRIRRMGPMMMNFIMFYRPTVEHRRVKYFNNVIEGVMGG